MANAQQKVVVHFADGKILKGFSGGIDTSSADFILTPEGADSPLKNKVVIPFAKIKAVFFVKSMAGSRTHVDRKVFKPGQIYQGRKIRVVFKDGEIMVGSTMHYEPNMTGFFFFPADLDGNTVKVFASAASISEVSFL